ncbi:hypothetical protein GLOIN_2v1768396 [Rhizophagus irregularis DAOM 181602=DAOM 197198]|nr:hypothetical protein GLOIN_2v1768396 [Rhizophagus irregularis DAOM 181602=DAOM 197198]
MIRMTLLLIPKRRFQMIRPSGYLGGRSKSRLPISILPADETDEKRKHIIGLVLEQFPYLSLRYSENYGDKFVFNSSVPCPICNKDHEARMVKMVDGAVVSILENEFIALSAEGKMVCQ